jgi:hypothetical protein
VNNHNWKGGRVIDPRGYVLLRMPEHPRADVRGYVYEHIVIAEQTLGRPILPSEVVHHQDENKGNNSPDNLIVMASSFAHHVQHRQHPSGRQLPGEPNTFMACACGCGDLFTKFDAGGRPRQFISGHNAQPAPTATVIVSLLVSGPLHKQEIVSRAQKSVLAVSGCLSRLKRQGKIIHISHGMWALATH